MPTAEARKNHDELVSGLVVDCPGSGSSTPRSVSTSLVTCRKSNILAMPT